MQGHTAAGKGNEIRIPHLLLTYSSLTGEPKAGTLQGSAEQSSAVRVSQPHLDFC
jgi:hypothetical protein